MRSGEERRTTMKKIYALCMTVLLSVACTLPVGAQHSLPAKVGNEPCASGENGAGSRLVTAIVSTIDLRRKRATLETSMGPLELAATPAELQALQTGDVLTLCVDPAALPRTHSTAFPSRG